MNRSGINYYKAGRTNTKTNDFYSDINSSVVLAKTHVPFKHKQLASNYMLIKKIFGYSAAAIPITQMDKSILYRHGFTTLENTTISQMNRQIEQVKNWANGGDVLLSVYANEIFEIRIKELKFLKLSMPSGRSVEFQDGYKALEKYIEYIAR